MRSLTNKEERFLRTSILSSENKKKLAVFWASIKSEEIVVPNTIKISIISTLTTILFCIVIIMSIMEHPEWQRALQVICWIHIGFIGLNILGHAIKNYDEHQIKNGVTEIDKSKAYEDLTRYSRLVGFLGPSYPMTINILIDIVTIYTLILCGFGWCAGIYVFFESMVHLTDDSKKQTENIFVVNRLNKLEETSK